MEEQGEKIPKKDNIKYEKEIELDSIRAEIQADNADNSLSHLEGSRKKGHSSKPIKYGQRMQLIHERKRRLNQEKKEQAAKEFANRKKEKDRRELIRQKHRKQMTNHTNKGQPLMNGRINRLLDKIKQS